MSIGDDGLTFPNVLPTHVNVQILEAARPELEFRYPIAKLEFEAGPRLILRTRTAKESGLTIPSRGARAGRGSRGRAVNDLVAPACR